MPSLVAIYETALFSFGLLQLLVVDSMPHEPRQSPRFTNPIAQRCLGYDEMDNLEHKINDLFLNEVLVKFPSPRSRISL